MDRMEIVDKRGVSRYRIEGDSVFEPSRCQHMIDEMSDRCRFCRVSRAQLEAMIQQQDPAHNQF
jgi:hypothetical protein